jgi:GPH family glycoside/pentoside/hexuronide:cation symporter
VGVLALLVSPFSDTVKVFGNAPFRLLTLVKLFQLSVLYTVLTCSPYFFTYVLKLGNLELSRYLLLFSIAGIASVPVHRLVIARLGKRQSFIALLVLYAMGLASWFVWVPGEPQWAFFARAVFIGACSTGTLLCALAMLPDTMEYDRLVSGEGREGIMSGVFTFVENFAGAIGPFIIGLLLQAGGLVASRDPATIQPAQVLEAVQWGVSIIPAFFCLAAVPLLLFYRLDETELANARATAAQSG